MTGTFSQTLLMASVVGIGLIDRPIGLIVTLTIGVKVMVVLLIPLGPLLVPLFGIGTQRTPKRLLLK